MLARLLFVGFIGIGPGEILVEVLDEFGVGTDRTCDDRHDVLCEGSGLIRANNGSICHGLARTENADQEILVSHSLGRESQGQGHCQWETCVGNLAKSGSHGKDAMQLTFRYSDDHQGDRDDENLDKVHRFLSSRAGGR
jgi:hypothetical protein